MYLDRYTYIGFVITNFGIDKKANDDKKNRRRKETCRRTAKNIAERKKKETRRTLNFRLCFYFIMCHYCYYLLNFHLEKKTEHCHD